MLSLLQLEGIGPIIPSIFELPPRLFFECLSHEFSLIVSYFLGGSFSPWQDFVILRDVSGTDMISLHVYRDFLGLVTKIL